MDLLNCLPRDLFDAWTVCHALGWALMAVALRVRSGADYVATALACGLVAIGWECIEPHTVELWFGFQEPWWNRWITDPLADGVGTVLGLAIASGLKANPSPGS